MATVSKEMAELMISLKGQYMDDPLVHQVVRYTNHWGAEAWAILYRQDVALNRYAPSPYIINPVVVWSINE